MEVENNEEYDSLYNQGFDEGITDVESTEPKEEEVVETEEVVEDTEEVTEEQPESKAEEEEVTEPDEEVTEPETTDTEDSEEPKLFEVKHNGQVMKLTEEEVLMMANKGFDYTYKTQDLAGKRRTLDGLDDELLQAVSDAKGGNKEAVAKLVRDFGIDPYDIDTEQTTYKPVVEDKNYELDDVIANINKDTPNAETLNGWVDRMPQKSKDFLANNPVILNELYGHTVNGISQKVMPEVMKQMALNPELDFMGTYNQIHSVLIKQPEDATEEVTIKPVATKDAKKKASVSKSKSNSRINDHKDIWEDDDLYKKMQEMRRR